MTKAQLRTKLNKELNKINTKTLQGWIDEASQIEGLGDALEGFYCGREGEIHVEVGNSGVWLRMGWYAVGDTPKVEYAYAS